MKEDGFFFYLLLLHAAGCLILLILGKKKKIAIPGELYPILLLVPVWGAVMAGIQHRQKKKEKQTASAIDFQHFEYPAAVSARPFVAEELAEKQVMPLDEALLLEDASLSRRLMKDIVQEDFYRFIPILTRGRLSEDTEVSHYASAAIMQIQTNFEVALSKMEEQEGKTAESLKEYINLLKEYIKSGLLTEYAKKIQHWKLQEALEEYAALYPEDRQTYLDRIENCLETDQHSKAAKLLEEMEQLWGQDETVFLLRLKYYYQTQDGRAMQAALRNAREANLYLSPATRSRIAFWQEEEGEGSERDAT